MTPVARAAALAAALLAGPHAAALAQGPHGTLSPGLDCAACHSPDDWKVNLRTVAFDHDRAARFKLEGRHREAACRSCHLSLRFSEPALEDAECASCHADVHRGAFAAQCAECHTPAGFGQVPALEVHRRTSFALTGAHAGLACQACHVDDRLGAFAPLDPQCVECHRADYAAARPLDHQAAGFPTDCTECHTTLAWAHGVRFEHAGASGGFALVGAHARLACARCHDADLGPLFQPAGQNDCVACHDDDYQREHSGTGFPPTCLDCHTVETWGNATFADHGLVFPIDRGPHSGRSCQDCHVQPGDFRVFSCLGCHRQAETDGHHREEPGYRYESSACYSCHPDGRAG